MRQDFSFAGFKTIEKFKIHVLSESPRHKGHHETIKMINFKSMFEPILNCLNTYYEYVNSRRNSTRRYKRADFSNCIDESLGSHNG